MHPDDFEPYVLVGPASLYQGYNTSCICGITVRYASLSLAFASGRLERERLESLGFVRRTEGAKHFGFGVVPGM
jgi:hypothetical protein